MSAPLYSRFRRYSDREIKRYPKKSYMARILPSWKRPDTRVYSLSERASYEAGYWSTAEPAELLRGLSMAYLPTPQVWIEFDWYHFNKGTNRIPFDDHQRQVIMSADGYEPHNPATAPVRMGMMYYQPNTPQGKGEWRGPSGCIMGFMFYVYPSGSSYIGPPVFGFHPSEPIDPPIEIVDTTGGLRHMMERNLTGNFASPGFLEDKRGLKLERIAMGVSYCKREEPKHPRLIKRLQERTMLTTLAHSKAVSWKEIEGSTRIALAVLTAALSAKAPHYDPTSPKDLSAPRERPRGPERDRPIEVDLFIRERPRKPGGSIRASVGHLEAVRKGLHTVAAHYAYRSRKDGGDPRDCTRAAQHDFEKIEGSKSQVCIFCGQKRWFKQMHERGDEAYGVVPSKTYNVRAGLIPAPKETADET